MKRGLVVLDPQEIPPLELAGRVNKLQHLLQQQGIAAALIYGDVYRSSDISYLSNICIYWNEGLLVIPANGEPVLLSKLSGRVHPWMRSVSNLQDLRSGPHLAELVSKYLGENLSGTVGLVEMDWWPATLVDDLRARLPGWQLSDLGPIVRRERRHPSESELRLLEGGAGISAQAVAAAADRGLTNPERAGRAERSARMAGVEDVYVYCQPATDHADTVEVLAEYRGYWTTAARVVLKGSPDWVSLLVLAYQAAERRLTGGVDAAEVRQAANAVLAATAFTWRLDLIDHTDLETQGDYRLPGEERIGAGRVIGMRLEFTFADGTQAVAADTFAIRDNGRTRLTKDLPDVFLAG